MNPTWSFIQALLPTLLLIHCVVVNGVNRANQWAPNIEILEILPSADNETEVVRYLNKPKNSDIIVGEDVHPNSRLLIKCNATFPVQFIYIGSGRPEFTTFTNVQWREDPQAPLTFEAEVSLGLLGFQGALREEDTGNYTCRSIQNATILSYYYLYVPGPGLIPHPEGSTNEVPWSPKDKNVLIPCSVAHPRAVVSLHKTDNGKLQCPALGPNIAAYNPRKGFLLNLKEIKNPKGTYLCIASKDNSFQMREFHLKETNGSLCSPNPCGTSAECSVVDGYPVCYCFRGLSGNPYSECIMNKDRCNMNRDCPKGQVCVQGKCSKTPCDPNPCGNGSTCLAYGGRPRCSCKTGYDGKPPYCLRKCLSNSDCPQSSEACLRNYCQSICPGRCGQGAECQVKTSGYDNRTAVCTCPRGTFGDPLERCDDPNGTKCPPGYVGPGPPNCRKIECTVDRDCPSDKFCKDKQCLEIPGEGCPKNYCGVNAECQLARTSGLPTCSCPPRSTGDPFVRCSPINGTNPCERSNPCPGDSQCELNFRGEVDCVCPRGYRGQPPNCVPEPQKCLEDEDCPRGEECIGAICIGACGGPCGVNAKCVGSECQCLQSYAGDPYTICNRSGPELPDQSPCLPSPCANFAECRVINGLVACRCILGYQARPDISSARAWSRDPPVTGRPPFEPGFVDEDDYRPSFANNNPINQPPQSPRRPPPTLSRLPPPQPSRLPPPSPPPQQPPPSWLPPPGQSSRPRPPPLTPSRLPPPSPPPQSSWLPPSSRPGQGPPPPPRFPPPNGQSSQEYPEDECNTRRFGECGPLHRCQRDYDGIARCICVSVSCQRETQSSRDQRSKSTRLCQSDDDCYIPDVCVNSTCIDLNPCGPQLSPCSSVANSECHIVEGRALCTCQRGYVGSPANGLDCRRDSQETGTSSDIVPLVICDLERGTGCDTKSQCRLVDGRPICVCGYGFTGNYPDCRFKCQNDLDCVDAHECIQNQCVNPCEKRNACGNNAFCRVVDHTLKCECQPGYSGNPWVGCIQKSHVRARGLPMKCNGLRCTFY